VADLGVVSLLRMRTACNGRICQTRISMRAADQKPDYHLEWPFRTFSSEEVQHNDITLTHYQINYYFSVEDTFSQ